MYLWRHQSAFKNILAALSYPFRPFYERNKNFFSCRNYKHRNCTLHSKSTFATFLSHYFGVQCSPNLYGTSELSYLKGAPSWWQRDNSSAPQCRVNLCARMRRTIAKDRDNNEHVSSCSSSMFADTSLLGTMDPVAQRRASLKRRGAHRNGPRRGTTPARGRNRDRTGDYRPARRLQTSLCLPTAGVSFARAQKPDPSERTEVPCTRDASASHAHRPRACSQSAADGRERVPEAYERHAVRVPPFSLGWQLQTEILPAGHSTLVARRSHYDAQATAKIGIYTKRNEKRHARTGQRVGVHSFRLVPSPSVRRFSLCLTIAN